METKLIAVDDLHGDLLTLVSIKGEKEIDKWMGKY